MILTIEAVPTRAADSFAGQHHSDIGPFEVFWGEFIEFGEGFGEGWFWWPCHPGCLPDGDPTGPFNSSGEAWKDAMNGGGDAR